MSPINFEKQARNFAFPGSRLRIPHVFHEELRAKLGGADPHGRLMAWYGEVNAEIELDGTPILDVFEFLRPKFKTWAASDVMDAEIEKFRPKGA